MTTPLEYANQPPELSMDRSLRQLIAVTAVAYGAVGVIGTFTYVGLVQGWLASPRNSGWSYGGAGAFVILVIRLVAEVAAVTGGVLLLRRQRASVWLIRGAVLALCVTALVSTILTAQDPDFREYWSSPGAAVMQAMTLLNALWLPIVLGLLTHARLTPRLV